MVGLIKSAFTEVGGLSLVPEIVHKKKKIIEHYAQQMKDYKMGKCRPINGKDNNKINIH